MLSHIVYLSSRKPNCTSEEIEKILQSCNKNNKDFDLTGVLLYSDKQFVQYLEGDYNNIISLYDKIKGDTRHDKIFMIASGPIENRAFPSWQMGSKKIDFQSIEFNTKMSREEQEDFKNILNGKENNNAMSLVKKFFK
ncbi:BLUF domain-containing protein [Marinigracilibium pacificum]|uniref:BLUF domain-containing protein n=1 Tax=Marinigracilibium pacificum TaxID=2729599 RepID=A0A848IYJ0_9BACT|nr:BLUF domain-containing protein [Marinigracilibium pacificum]NMM48345.1 BLUF domain-containing protein [Marinigracilibium pacificum]